MGRLVFALLVAGATACSAYVLTYGNTVDPTKAGIGTEVVSDFSITLGSNPYTLNASNPQSIDEVRFTIAPATTSQLQASLKNGTWHDCTNSGGSVTCAISGVTQSEATQLRVVAVR